MQVFRYYFGNYSGKVEFPYSVAYHFNGHDGKEFADVQTFPFDIRVNGRLCEKLLSLKSLEQESIEKIIGESKFTIELRGKNRKDSKSKARGAINSVLLGRTKTLISRGYVSLIK